MPAQYMYPSAPAAETRPPIYMYMYDSLPLSYFAPPPPSIEGSKRLRRWLAPIHAYFSRSKIYTP